MQINADKSVFFCRSELRCGHLNSCSDKTDDYEILSPQRLQISEKCGPTCWLTLR